jgi:hypothetical protein
MENFTEGLRILANISIDSGCKAEIVRNPEEGRGRIRQCCGGKGLDLCYGRPEFPCNLLKSNLDVEKFHRVENSEEKGFWIDKQLSVHRENL